MFGLLDWDGIRCLKDKKDIRFKFQKCWIAYANEVMAAFQSLESAFLSQKDMNCSYEFKTSTTFILRIGLNVQTHPGCLFFPHHVNAAHNSSWQLAQGCHTKMSMN